MLAVGIACVATLCSNRGRMIDGTAGAIARAAGYNYLKLRVYSNPNFGSEGWDSDSDSDDDDEQQHETVRMMLDQAPALQQDKEARVVFL
ncbi:hypothetical protein BVRB_4g094100 [Beta vulgaris subsp. vulgaris]|nr:hypothetical protein BVRB_4g094100 [Beta vulgaris subsp. vulgaris]